MLVLLADDHTLFRKGLALLLAKLHPGVQVQEAEDADIAFQMLEKSKGFDLILLDYLMPGMEDGAAISRFVRAAGETPVVVISAIDDSDAVFNAIAQGARGYILKSANEEVLRHATALILSGETYIPRSILFGAHGKWQSGSVTDRDPGAPEESIDAALASLSPRQLQTLERLMLGKSNKEIARDLGLLENTVKTHVKVLMRKLNAANRTQAALIASRLRWPTKNEDRH